MALSTHVIQLNDHIVEGIEALRQVLGEHVALSTALAPGLGLIEVDPSQLQAAIVDLAIHVHDAMLQGGRFVIETRNVVRDEHHADLPRRAYVQLSFTCTGSGTPLAGLPLARIFVEHYGALITTETNDSTVNFYFPRAARTHAA
jgi:hypothetical protein